MTTSTKSRLLSYHQYLLEKVFSGEKLSLDVAELPSSRRGNLPARTIGFEPEKAVTAGTRGATATDRAPRPVTVARKGNGEALESETTGKASKSSMQVPEADAAAIIGDPEPLPSSPYALLYLYGHDAPPVKKRKRRLNGDRRSGYRAAPATAR